MSPGCRPCREEIPTLEALQPKAALSGVTLVLVITADLKNAQTFVQDLGVSLSVLITEPEGKFKADYKVGGTPFYCLVNERVEVEATGFLDPAWRAITAKWEVQEKAEASVRLSGR
jgi:thiol-disulfide isomerase/thioredoxin